ncbi:hypothetical protein GCM10009836_63370 [Pseudonocardia ailaonensis]|uniref:Methyltransferase n=1 Tax=Pseudonocardia ailaonensis TaxID=367279 RepID=A0ABN2NLN5_9PSEU
MTVIDVRFAAPTGGAGPDQDEEWCEVTRHGSTERIRFHDYAAIFAVPGLYERIFHDLLECCSPRVVADLLAEVLPDPGAARVLELGAGNGLVGAELRRIGVRHLAAVDILPEAAAAAERDRPGTYDAYHLMDLTRDDTTPLGTPDVLVTVAALGFGDIPPEAFAAAFRRLRPGGLVAFTIKEEFLGSQDRSGFADLIARTDGLTTLAERRYVHRRTMYGAPLHYVARIARRQPAGPETARR